MGLCLSAPPPANDTEEKYPHLIQELAAETAALLRVAEAPARLEEALARVAGLSAS